MMNDQFWVYDPGILFKRYEFIPQQGMTKERRLNALTRLIVIITIIMLIIFRNNKKILFYVVIFMISSLSVVMLIYITDKDDNKIMEKSGTINVSRKSSYNYTKSKTEFFICDSKNKIYTYKGFKKRTQREFNICASKKRR